MRQLDPQKSRRIRWHRPRHRGPHPRKKSPQTPTRIQPPDRPANRRSPLRALQAALDGIDGEDGDPHGHARGAARRHHGRQTQLPAPVAVGVDGRHRALDVFVRREVRGRAGPVARERHGRAAEHAADAAFFVQLAHDVEATGVAGLFAGGELLLALDLEEHFDAFEGGGDEGHGDGGEEAGAGDLRDAVLVVGDRGEGLDEAFAHVVALRVGLVGAVVGGEGSRGGGTQKLTATRVRGRVLVEGQWQSMI